MTMIVDDGLILGPGAHDEGVVDRDAGDLIDALGLDVARVLLEARQVLGRARGRKRARHGEQGDAAALEELFSGDRLGTFGGRLGQGHVRQLVANLDRHRWISLASLLGLR
jgi:hypothetical protein